MKSVGGINEDDDASKTQDNELCQERDASFDQLVLPPGHKEMVLSLVAQHYRNKDAAFPSRAQSDIVRGKGR